MTYAVFDVNGLKDIPATFDHIMKEWLPASDYEYNEGPDFELYPEDFSGPADTLQIYFPVKKK
jgi:predicted transcriptional regulator YdeE